MVTVTETTLVKWGNSQGIRVSKETCELLGVGLGAKAKMQVNATASQLILTFEQPKRKFHRTRKVTIEELFVDYEGSYEPPTDWSLNGSEIDWGGSMGEEVW